MRVSVKLLSALVLACVPACGGPMTQVRTKNTQLTARVDELRSELRSERRKRRDLENQVFLLQDRLETQQLRRPDGAPPPQLPVEVLSPDDVPENGQLVGTTDDGTAIIYIDEATSPPVELDDRDLAGNDRPAPPRPRSRPRTSHAARAPSPPRAPLRDLPTSTELVEPGAGAGSAALDDEGGDPALSLYRRGTAALKAREHSAAVAAFRDLVARFPQHDYADNAQYWLGEAFYDQKDYARAITEFRATVSRYPRGNKVPDALLKIGFAYQALGETDKARAALEQVVSLYPGSSPAAIAAARLEKP
ncbi:MAG TPA: tol-pal system protein YbgF [Kofleriaceae bacterium]|nr:tol-pal system protein YbgF [Kofleriaceae bacterium]